MKKLTKVLAVVMTGGLLLVACGDADDVDNNDLLDIEETEDDLMNDDLDEEMDE